MRAEIFKRMMEIQEEKLDILWEFTEGVTKLFVENLYDVPPNIREGYIKLAKPFIEKYNALLGEDTYGEEEEED